jgi:hypothetical protein
LYCAVKGGSAPIDGVYGSRSIGQWIARLEMGIAALRLA